MIAMGVRRNKVRGRHNWRTIGRVALVLSLAGCHRGESRRGVEPADGYARGSRGENATHQIDKPYLVLASFDGFRHDYMELFDTPNFDRMEASGRAGRRAHPGLSGDDVPESLLDCHGDVPR